MEFLWRSGPDEAKDVHHALGKCRGITLNTIQSTLKRLWTKGLLMRKKVSHAHLYAPIAGRDEYIRRVLVQLLDGLTFDEPTVMAQAFIDVTERAGEVHLERLERLLAERRRSVRGRGEK